MIKSRLICKQFSYLINKAIIDQAKASCLISTKYDSRFFQTATTTFRQLDRINVLNFPRLDCDPKDKEDKQFLETLNSLYLSAKQNNLDLDVENNKEDLEKLFELIYHNVRKLDTTEVVTVFNILSYFHVPAGTMIMQRTMQMIRTNINELSPRQIILLHKILLKLDKTYLGDAIVTSLPIVFEQAIKHQLVGQDIELLANALDYAVRNKLAGPHIYRIKQLIEADISQLTLNAAQKIVIAMQHKNKQLYFCKHITYEALRIIAKTKNVPYEQVREQLRMLFPIRMDNTLQLTDK